MRNRQPSLLAAVLGIAGALLGTALHAQSLNINSLAPNVVVGRLGSGRPGPAQAIPFTSFPSLATTGPLTITTPNQSQTQGFNIQHIGTNSNTATATEFFWNFIQIANDNTNYTPTNAHDTGLEIQMNVGANAGGSHYGIESLVIQNQTPANPSGDYIGGSFGVYGQNTNPNGSMYGSQNFVQVQFNNQSYNITSGAEFDNIVTATSTGNTITNRFGIDIGGTSPIQGTTRDAMIELAGGGVGKQWKTGILLSLLHGGPPLDSTVGCIICGDGGAQTILNGIDLSTVTVTGSIIKGNGSFISGTGSGGFQTVQIGSGPTYVLAVGDLGMEKISASLVAPGAGALKLEVVAGTNSGSCKIIALAGTSATPVTVIDNVGSGC